MSAAALVAQAIQIDERSSASQLRSATLLRSKLSFAFFVRAALGLRSFGKLRCEALQAQLVEPTPVEAKLLCKWRALQEGELPLELAWTGGGGEVR